MRLHSRLYAAFPALLVVLASAPARAQNWSFHAEGAVVASASDNALSQAEGEGQPDPEADVFWQLRPGLLSTYETPRSVHEASYAFDALIFTTNSDRNTVTHSMVYQGLFQTSRFTEFGLSAGAGIGQVNAGLQQRPAGADPLIQPEGGAGFRAVNAGQSFRWDVGRDWRFSQASGAQYTTTDAGDNDTEGAVLGGSLGLEKGWRWNSVGLTVNGAYNDLERRFGAQPSETQQQVTTTTALNWRRDLSLRWSSNVAAGVSTITPLKFFIDGVEQPSETLVLPTGAASLAFVDMQAAVTASISRAVGANLFVAQTTVNNAFQLNATVPLPWAGENQTGAPLYTAQTSLGYSRSQLFALQTSELEGSVDLYLVDLAVVHTPDWIPGSLITRYQYQNQRGDDDPTLMRGFASFDRHTVSIALQGRFPERTAATVPDRFGRRVDGSDEEGFGDQRGLTPEQGGR